MGNFIKEFKEFAVKGNALDMAVGVIIGGAFGKIVSSVVSDIIMPPLGVLIGGVNFTDLKVTLKDAVLEQKDALGNVVQEAVPAVNLNYGAFLQNCLDFIIIAFAIFLMIKGITRLSQLGSEKKAEEPAAPAASPEPSAEEKLLTEIRDLLKEK